MERKPVSTTYQRIWGHKTNSFVSFSPNFPVWTQDITILKSAFLTLTSFLVTVVLLYTAVLTSKVQSSALLTYRQHIHT